MLSFHMLFSQLHAITRVNTGRGGGGQDKVQESLTQNAWATFESIAIIRGSWASAHALSSRGGSSQVNGGVDQKMMSQLRCRSYLVHSKRGNENERNNPDP